MQPDLKIFPDYGHPWPLWLPGTDEYAVSPHQLGLPQALTEHIRRWHQIWLNEFDVETGAWSSSRHRAAYLDEAGSILQQLRAEYPGRVELALGSLQS